MSKMKKPLNFEQLNDEELCYDGGSKVPWWGWLLISVGAAGLIGASVYGGVKLHNARNAVPEPEEFIITASQSEVLNAGGVRQLETVAGLQWRGAHIGADGSVTYRFAMQRMQ